MTRRFGLTYDYRCPYARIAHDHVVEGLRAGADWDVTFLPFSLGQAHVAEGEPSVWERPEVGQRSARPPDLDRRAGHAAGRVPRRP